MGESAQGSWRIWIDTGGTFTDCIAIDAAGAAHREKVLSSGALRGRVLRTDGPRRVFADNAWSAPTGFFRGFRLRSLNGGSATEVVASEVAGDEMLFELDADASFQDGDPFELASDEEAPVIAARLVTRTPAGSPMPPLEMRLATTRGTNALLERRGGPVAFFVTRGFRDLLRIGTQQRPDLFSLDIRRPDPLYKHVIEVDERISARGEVLRAPDFTALDESVASLRRAGVRCAAISLLHSWINPAHEHLLAAYLRSCGFEHVSESAHLAPAIKILPRAQTTVVNAFLAPVIEQYRDNVEQSIGAESLHFMTSAGGLVPSSDFTPKDSLLSGPAAGVLGAAAAARRSGFSKVISFDMGGTSTDVARFDGEISLVFEHHVGDATIVAPAVAVESVAAGGGSVCWYDATGEVGMRVGPMSAGAAPGPACYGAGGPLTITDANLLLGRLDPTRFRLPIDLERARDRVGELGANISAAGGGDIEPDALLQGLIDVADESMAQAIRRISVQRGFDPSDHVLVAYGGAGGQHACGVADRLAVSTVMIPPDVGLLSAAGLGVAQIARITERQVLRPLSSSASWLAAMVQALAAEAAAKVRSEGVDTADVVIRRVLFELRQPGQESSLTIEAGSVAEAMTERSLRQSFIDRYQVNFGYPPLGNDIEVVSIRVVASTNASGSAPASQKLVSAAEPVSSIRSMFNGRWSTVPIIPRDGLRADQSVTGPALIPEAHATTIIPPGWRASVDAAGAIIIRRVVDRAPNTSGAAHREILTGRLLAIAEEMGETLRRTSLSTNVKERLDFSCAILDPEGRLIANAPHIPVHLGALGVCVRAVGERLPLHPGDVAVTNHPAFGGSHLPDITVITPVFDAADHLIAHVACRAHHAEIGGIRPGSMPPFARSLAEEGVVIPPMLIVSRGESRLDDLRRLLLSAPWPTRAVEDNMADLAAQIAANARGAAAIGGMAAAFGVRAVADIMNGLHDRSEARIRESLVKLGDRTLTASEALDDGSPIAVAITIRAGTAIVDFGGSADAHSGNFNASPGVVRSAVIYVLRLLIDEPLPLNEGLMRVIDLRIPPGMLNPRFTDDAANCPAVAAGNVETSQRVVDTLLKAFGLAACSQGTMNNLLFGNDRFGYYETICGGAGAGPQFHGAHAVHTHMTNTRITDPEIIEHRYPVRLNRFEIRQSSGGAGRFRGGDGVIREIEFQEPVSLSLLSQHRASGPFGLDGGRPGFPGAQRLVKPKGVEVMLEGVASLEVSPGERLIVETPGGGGFGSP